METVKIKSIKKKLYSGKVYNIAVQGDESYTANGISVHNCRSMLVPITQVDDWDGVEDEEPSKNMLAEGFGK